MESKEMIRQIPIFSDLNDQELDLIFRSIKKRTYPENSLVIQQGEPGDSFFHTVSGVGKYVLYSKDGQEAILSEFSKGEFFGEIAVLDGKPRTSSVVTKTACEFWIIEGKDLLEIMTGHPGVAIKVIKSLCEKLRGLIKKVEFLTFSDATGQVTSYILKTAKKDGIPIKQAVRIENFPSEQEISSLLTIPIEIVSKVLKNMKEQGYIAKTGSNLIVHEDAFF